MTNPTTNTAALRAQDLLAAASALGGAIRDVEQLAREGQTVIRDEEAAADTVLLSGPEVMSALRRLAMHLDRAALAGAA